MSSNHILSDDKENICFLLFVFSRKALQDNGYFKSKKQNWSLTLNSFKYATIVISTIEKL